MGSKLLILGHRFFHKSFLLVLFLTIGWQKNAYATEQGSSFNEIYRQVFSQPYVEMPVYKVNRRHFGRAGKHVDNQVYQAGIRSLTLEEDLYDFPNGQKLFQANGICFTGQWLMDQPSDFTGLFSEGTQLPVIARASVALNGTEQKHKRAFGMAVKIFPTTDPDEAVQTRNLFVMHSLGGVRVKHVADLSLDNAPSLGSIPPIGQIPVALRLRRDFERADREVSEGEADVSFRSVRHLAGVSTGNFPVEETLSPTWIRLRIEENTARVDRNDFRDELRTQNYPQGRLTWLIEAATGERGKKKQADWKRLGRLSFDESVTSAACDQRLHFSIRLMSRVIERAVAI